MDNIELIGYLKQVSTMQSYSKKLRTACATAAERLLQQDYAINQLIGLKDCSNCRLNDVQPKPDACNVCLNTTTGPSEWRPKGRSQK